MDNEPRQAQPKPKLASAIKNMQNIQNIQSAYDLNKDGTVTPEEIQHNKLVSEIEQKRLKSFTQHKIAWLSSISLTATTALLLLPIIDIPRIQVLYKILEIFYFSQSAIITTYMGISLWSFGRGQPASKASPKPPEPS